MTNNEETDLHNRIMGLLVAGLLACPVSVYAVPVELDLDVTIGNLSAGSPVDEIRLIFNLSFDTSDGDTNGNIFNATSGLNASISPILTTGAIGYDYFASADSLTIGGTLNGVGGFSDGTNDWLLGLSGVTTGTPTPTFFLFTQESYRELPAGSRQFSSSSFTLNSTAPPTSVPEPSTLALLGLGLAGLGFARRKRAAV